jgi:hypothetical protein
MSDPVTVARAARQELGRALIALQAPNAPPAWMDAAETIAAAMGTLHRIEATQGRQLQEIAPTTLATVRQALRALQAQLDGSPALDEAAEAVAEGLSLVHGLAHPTAAVATATTAGEAPGPATVSTYGSPAPIEPRPDGVRAATPAADALAPPWPPPAKATPVADALSPAWPPPVAATAGPNAPAAVAAPMASPGAPPTMAFPGSPPAPQALTTAPNGPARLVTLTAELGMHSASNFYRGLSGTDVVEAGGIFVATYQIPAIGAPVRLRILLPGGYEFEARGVVRWTREAPDSGAQAPPGCGAAFTEITPEGRQLVHRYVRSREPLFHDDP